MRRDVPFPARHRRTWTAIRGVREIALIAAVYALYDVSRVVVKGRRSVALLNSRDLESIEDWLHVDPEKVLNHFVSRHVVLALSSDYVYATLHYIVTPVVLLWLWRRHGRVYGRARSILIVATILGLVGFSLLPVAPPRMLDGFTDTMASFAHDGWWSTHASAPRGLGGATNEYAAFPSLHVGWSLWCGWYLFRYGQHRVTRILGVAYPVVLAAVVMATANHYVIDVVAGAVTMVVAAAIVRLISSIRWPPWSRTASSSPSSSSRSAPA
jgi:hypothetical protein